MEELAVAESKEVEVTETVEQRSRAAVAMKIGGAPYSAIATTLGFASPVAARNVVERLLSDMVTDVDLKMQRKIASERVERLLRSIWPKATDPEATDQLQYVKTALMLIDRSARLHGLDAPQRLEVVRPSDAEVADWAYKVATEAGLMGVRESEDIMEAEILELDSEE